MTKYKRRRILRKHGLRETRSGRLVRLPQPMIRIVFDQKKMAEWERTLRDGLVRQFRDIQRSGGFTYFGRKMT